MTNRTNNPRFVFAGGPGAGKTTTLDAIAARGFQYVPDSARAIIKDRLESGLTPRPAPDQFGKQMLSQDIARYTESPVGNDPVFFDRGIVDSLGFLHHLGRMSLSDIEDSVKRFPYNGLVFVLPPWEEIYETDAERDQSFAEAVNVFESATNWYQRWGYRVVEVPRMSVDQRADFVLGTTKATLND